MRFSSYNSSHQIESEIWSNVPFERTRAPRSDDVSSLRVSGSFVDHLPAGTTLDLNSQDHIMSGYPVLPTIQREPICDLLAGAHISSLPAYINSDAYISRNAQSYGVGDVTLVGSEAEYGNRFGEGTIFPASVLASMFASRGQMHQHVDDPALYNNDNASAFLRGYASGGDPSTSFYRNFDSQIDADAANVWVQPSRVFYGGGEFDPKVTERGYNQDGWVMTPNTNLATDNQDASSRSGNELALSLATVQPLRICRPAIQDQCSEISGSGSITNHHEFGWGSEQTSYNTKDHSLTYASRRTSRSSQAALASSYLRAVQQILADLSRYSLENVDLGSYTSSFGDVTSVSGEDAENEGNESQTGTSSEQRQEADAKKTQLLALLKMVDDGYSQCLREVHNVLTSFHPITGLDPGVHVRFVIQTTSFLFKSLKERINAQILNLKAKEESASAKERELAFESSFIQKQWAIQQLRRKDHQLWRPQRGLPERSVSVLRAWMFENFLHPYPRDPEKHMLAMKSGLTRSQVSNWFINARVRLWKPMIEEMYAEINRRKVHLKGPVAENSGKSHSGMGNQRFRND